jgi:hypothetical protein
MPTEQYSGTVTRRFFPPLQRQILHLRRVTQWHLVCILEAWGKEDALMLTSGFDLFRKDVHGEPVWIDSATDLITARLRLTQLAEHLPGEYFIFDQTSRRIVANFVGLGSDRIHWETRGQNRMLIVIAFLGVLVIFVGLALTAAGICAVAGSGPGIQEQGKKRLIHANYRS